MAVTTLNMLYALIGVVVSAIVLWLFSAYVYGNKNKNFITAFFIALIVQAVTYVLGLFPYTFMKNIDLALTTIISFSLVKYLYKLKWVKALLVWLTWFVIVLVISYTLNLFTPISFSGGL